MERQSETRHAPPLAYHFVGQAGSKIDESTRSGIRSHAMKEVRNKQRQQKQVGIVKSGEQFVTENELNLYRCFPVAQVLSASSKQCLKRRRIDTSSTPLVLASDHCYHYRRAQLFGLSQSRQRDDVQQPSSSMATFAAVDLNPFNSIIDLPSSPNSKLSDEIKAIKQHG